MTLAYAPIDDEIVIPTQPFTPTPKQTIKKLLPDESTECNYVVMFFIAGVLMVALGDLMKS